MKLAQIHTLPLLVLLCSCSTLPLSAPQRTIALTDMERMRPGHATLIELKATLGDPAQKIATSTKEDTWVYTEPHGQSNWQRASFTIDKKSGTVLASVFLLNETDSLHDLDQAIQHFSSSRFVISEEGWVSGHEYSGNANYSDPINGISMTVKKARNTVSEVGFWQPLNTRVPLAEQKKTL